MIIGKMIDSLSVGQTAQFAKTVAETDIYLYAGITGDFNPAHVNEDYARGTFFKTRIAHGIPMGSSLDFSDEVTIKRALEGRAPL